MKAKTIDEVCNAKPGSFQETVAYKKAFLKNLEDERKVRIRKARANKKTTPNPTPSSASGGVFIFYSDFIHNKKTAEFSLGGLR